MNFFIKREIIKYLSFFLFVSVFIFLSFHISSAEEESLVDDEETNLKNQEYSEVNLESHFDLGLQDIIETAVLETQVESESNMEISIEDENDMIIQSDNIFGIDENLTNDVFSIPKTKEIFSEEFRSIIKPVITTGANRLESDRNRIYQGTIDVDSAEAMTCSFSDLTKIPMKYRQSAQVSIFIVNNEEYSNIEIGSLPRGFEVFFSENNKKQINSLSESGAITLTVEKGKNAQKGSFIIPIIFKIAEGEQVSICQINLIN